VVTKERNSQLLVKLPPSNAPSRYDSSARTLDLNHLYFLDTRESCGLPEGARIIVIKRIICLCNKMSFLNPRPLLLFRKN
jgi:hypothetical protein